MKQFILLLSEDIGLFDRYSPAEMQDILNDYRSWSASMAQQDKLAGGQQLHGDIITLTKQGDKVMTDGPMTEAKEIVGGYFILKAADMNEAIELSKTCPHLKYGGKMAVREVVLRNN